MSVESIEIISQNLTLEVQNGVTHTLEVTDGIQLELTLGVMGLQGPQGPAGSGDMDKAVYDTNDNGIVDAAESVPWSGVTGKPSIVLTSDVGVTVQPLLDSGTNIKTVNGNSLLGAGDIIAGEVTLTGTETLTNKTIDNPRISQGLLDTNGNKYFQFTPVTSAVNFLNYYNAATGGTPTFTASGSDADIDINLASKGVGKVKVNNVEVVTTSTSQTLTNKKITTGQYTGDSLFTSGDLTNTDGVVVRGRAGGSSSYRVVLTPTTLSSNRTLTLPNTDGTVLTTGTTVTVAQGGTGLTTLTSNNVILGNGTSTPNFVAPGTSGNVLTSNGTTWTSAAGVSLSSNNAFTGANTFINNSGQRFARTATSDGVLVHGNGSGSSSFNLILQPSPLTASRIVQFPDVAGTVVLESASQTLGNKVLQSCTLNSAILNDGYTEEVFNITGTAPALNPSNGSIQTWTLTGNSTPISITWNSGQSITLMIDDGSAFNITWTTLAVTWKTDSGTAPTLNTTGFTAIALWKVGSVIYGARVGNA